MNLSKKVISCVVSLAAVLSIGVSATAKDIYLENTNPQVTLIENMSYEQYKQAIEIRNKQIEQSLGKTRHSHVFKSHDVGFKQNCFNGSGNEHIIIYTEWTCTLCGYSKDLTNPRITSCPSVPKCKL